MTLIATVLRSGGEYGAAHVQRLHQQFGGLPAVCLSDVPVPNVRTVPLWSYWPGWFAKMALFNPDLIPDDILYFDLDTLITGNIAPYLRDDRFRMLSDFFQPDKPASGMMFIPHSDKAHIWNNWMDDPQKWMLECRGDQDVLEVICGRDVARFGRRIKSYKVHVASAGMPGFTPQYSTGNGELPPDTDVLCFHGNPRPWDERLRQTAFGRFMNNLSAGVTHEP